jgi:2',3'-cyclic-nucleotide 2'-phosphodiesterase (5'-nucleotidase family)
MLERVFILMLMAAAWGCTGSFETPDQTVRHVRFLHVADLHAQLDEHWEFLREEPARLRRMGGFARLKTVLDRRRQSAPGALFTLDGGDTFHGSALASWTKGEAVVGPLNALAIDVGVPGNWDVAYGREAFERLFKEVSYQVVCYNCHDAATGVRLFAPAVVLKRGGVRVAFVGLTDPTTTARQALAVVRGLDMTRVNGLRAFVQDLRRRERPDLVALVDHTGLPVSVQLASEIPELDIVFSGHSHERVATPIKVGAVLVVEPGALGSFVGQLDLTVRAGRVVDAQYRLLPVDADQAPEDPTVLELIEQAKRPYKARLEAVVGATDAPLLRADILDDTADAFIADALREATRAEIAFTNGFRFGPPIAPGPVTEADLWNLVPFDPRLKIGRITGDRLLDFLEGQLELVFAKDPWTLSGGWGPRPSGLAVAFLANAARGKRLQQMTVAGDPLDPTRAYSIGGWELEGEPLSTVSRIPNVQDARYAGGTLHEALRAYLQMHAPLQERREGRMRAQDLPSPVWSQHCALRALWFPEERSAKANASVLNHCLD